MECLLEPTRQRRHVVPVGLILSCLTKVRVRPSQDDIITSQPRHDAYSILTAAPDGHLHSQLDTCLIVAIVHGRRHALRRKGVSGLLRYSCNIRRHYNGGVATYAQGHGIGGPSGLFIEKPGMRATIKCAGKYRRRNR